MKKMPIILISPFLGEVEQGKDFSFEAVKISYLDALHDCGGLPLVVALNTPKEGLSELADMADGFLIPGGLDVDPKLYSEKRHPKTELLSTERDALESTLIRLFMERDKPIFGICRGAQIINVTLGGTLHQDIKSEIPSGLCHQDPKLTALEQYMNNAHGATLKEGTTVASFFQDRNITVNSAHHQSVKSVAPGLRIGAVAEDGVIECVESEDMMKKWILGVQWHPEAMYKKHPEQKALFEKFIESAKKRS